MSNHDTKTIILFILGVICILISVLFKYIETKDIKKYYSNYSNLFASSEQTQDEKLSYIYPTNIQDLDLCKYQKNCYYIVYSDIYSFIVLMDKNNYTILQKQNLNKQKTRIVGTTKNIDTSLKQALISAYNTHYKDSQEDNLTSENFNNLFGKNFLDTINYDKKVVVNDNDITRKSRIIYITFLTIGLIFITYNIISLKKENTV